MKEGWKNLEARLQNYVHNLATKNLKKKGEMLLTEGNKRAIATIAAPVITAIANLPEPVQMKLVQAYNKKPAQFNPERALLCNIENWKHYCHEKEIYRIEDALDKAIPPISSFRKYTPEANILDYLEAILIKTILEINVKKNLNTRQIRGVAGRLLYGDKYYHLTLNEILYVLGKGKTGDYNPEGFYNSISPEKIYTWFDLYDQERAAHIEEKNHRKHLHRKQADLRASSYSPEGIKWMKRLLGAMGGNVQKIEKQVHRKIPSKQELNDIKTEHQETLKAAYPNDYEKSKQKADAKIQHKGDRPPK